MINILLSEISLKVNNLAKVWTDKLTDIWSTEQVNNSFLSVNKESLEMKKSYYLHALKLKVEGVTEGKVHCRYSANFLQEH